MAQVCCLFFLFLFFFYIFFQEHTQLTRHKTTHTRLHLTHTNLVCVLWWNWYSISVLFPHNATLCFAGLSTGRANKLTREAPPLFFFFAWFFFFFFAPTELIEILKPHKRKLKFFSLDFISLSSFSPFSGERISLFPLFRKLTVLSLFILRLHWERIWVQHCATPLHILAFPSLLPPPLHFFFF